MVLYRDEGVVIRTQKLGEADRIITLFSRHDGVKRVVAKGVRKTTSKFGATLEPFMLVDLQLRSGRSLDVVIQAQIIAPYGPSISSDYSRFEAASVIAETAEKLNQGAHFPEQYNLLNGALRALSLRYFDSVLIRDMYILRSVSFAGWSPIFSECVKCGSVKGLNYLSVTEGGAVCDECKPVGSVRINPETLTLLNAFLNGDWKTAAESSIRAATQAAGFISNYLQWHTEKSIKSLLVSQRALSF